MGVLRSVQGLQMYQRAVRGPIEGPSVVRFLLEHDRFPRAVRALLREIRRALAELPDPGAPLDAVDHVEAVLRESTAASTDGAALDDGDGRPAGRHRHARQADHRPLPAGGVCDGASDGRRPSPARVRLAAELLDRFLARPHRAQPAPGRGRPARSPPRSPATSCTTCARRRASRPPPNRPWRLDPIPLVLDGDGVRRAGRRRRGSGCGRWRRCSPTSTGRATPCGRGGCRPRRWRRRARYRLAAVGAPAAAAVADDVRRRRRRRSPTGRGASCRTSPTRRRAIGYALLDRSVMARVAAELLGPEGAGDLASISGFPAELRHALADARRRRQPAHRRCSRAASTTPAYVEHSSLARLLGFHLVEGPDLVVRKGRLWLRTLGGLDPIDVVYRRLSDAAVDPIEVSASSAAGRARPRARRPARAASCWPTATAAGVLEDPALAPYWPAAVEGLTGTSLTLRARSTPAAPSWRTVPAFRDGQDRRGASVVVRLHAVAGPDGVTVMAGGNGRVLARRRRPAPADGPAGQGRVGARRRPRRAADRGAAAAAGRPRVVGADARRRRPVLGRAGRRAGRGDRQDGPRRSRRAARQDPSLVSFDGGRWARRMAFVLRVVGGAPLDTEPPARPADRRPRRRAGRRDAGGAPSGSTSLLAEAATVGEYLSVTTGPGVRQHGRVARRAAADGRAADRRASTRRIADLAAFVGLWNESTVRGPAWRFGDIGRRIERSLVVLGLVDSCLRRRRARRRRRTAPDRAASIEPTTSSTDRRSRSCWRRTRASSPTAGTTAATSSWRRRRDLLLHDVDNPRVRTRRRCGGSPSTSTAVDWTAGSPGRRRRSPAIARRRRRRWRGVGEALRGRRGVRRGSSSTRGSRRR